jgi:hypothetical protein
MSLKFLDSGQALRAFRNDSNMIGFSCLSGTDKAFAYAIQGLIVDNQKAEWDSAGSPF